MKKFLSIVILGMIGVAVAYCNVCAVKDSAPFFKRQFDKINRWTKSATTTTRDATTSVKNRVVGIFDRREHKV